NHRQGRAGKGVQKLHQSHRSPEQRSEKSKRIIKPGESSLRFQGHRSKSVFAGSPCRIRDVLQISRAIQNVTQTRSSGRLTPQVRKRFTVSKEAVLKHQAKGKREREKRRAAKKPH